MTEERLHIPVLLERSIQVLGPALTADGAVLVDATLGMGGHSAAFLERFPGLRLIGIDRDPEALAIAGRSLARFGDRVRLAHAVYDDVDAVLDDAGVDAAQGMLFDLGVSSLQLDRADRGFAYAQDAPLDMRMDPAAELTAERIIADYDETDLRRIFRDYGEEKLAGRFAARIVRERAAHPITRSAQLVELIAQATPAAARRHGHPAKRVFQALRIEVNGELSVLERAIPFALARTAVGGRVAVMSYHSLEDRIVKRAFQAATTSSTPEGLPVELPEHAARFTTVLRGAEVADDDEKNTNPRAASVRFRAVERVRSDA